MTRKKTMKKTRITVVAASLLMASSAMASGFRIPEQSIDSVAKAGAAVASTDSADAAYFNPAAMTRLKDSWQFEGNATYLHLTSITYDSPLPLDGSSEKENFLLPTFFVVSPDYNNFRFGCSLTEPYGLQKRWTQPFPANFARKFGVKTFELNPTIAYKFNDIFSVAVGIRAIYSEAVVHIDGSALGRDSMIVNGDTTELGWNIGVDAAVTDNLKLAATYRSNVDLGWEGDVTVWPFGAGITVRDNGAVTVPAPAVLTFSAAYTIDKWTFDFTVDKTFWSEYKRLDFNFETLPNISLTKGWKDTIALRIGVDYQFTPALTLMAGFSYDKNPVPDTTVGFELPDSDAMLFSLGAKYKLNECLEIGAGILYDVKESRTRQNPPIVGEYSNASAILVSLGVMYTF